MSSLHFIFVDFENVREIDLDLIRHKPVKIYLALGKHHSSLPSDLVTKLLQFPDQVQIIKTSCSGKNALDFVLAYHIGVQSTHSPDSHFHILSRDQGFDALVDHLRSHQISVTRYEAFDRIPVFEKTPITVSTLSSPITFSHDSLTRIQDMTERFSHNLSRPKRKETLLAHIHIRFGKKLSEKELLEVFDGLIAHKVIDIAPDNTVEYHC